MINKRDAIPNSDVDYGQLPRGVVCSKCQCVHKAPACAWSEVDSLKASLLAACSQRDAWEQRALKAEAKIKEETANADRWATLDQVRYPEDCDIVSSDREYKREQERIRAWHRTRDAALTGLLAAIDGTVESVLETASTYADLAHRPLRLPPRARRGL